MTKTSGLTKSKTPKATMTVLGNTRVDIRKAHKDGQQILKQIPERGSGKSRNAAIKGLAKGLGINPAELWKRVFFAEKYDPQALQQLLELEDLT